MKARFWVMSFTAPFIHLAFRAVFLASLLLGANLLVNANGAHAQVQPPSQQREIKALMRALDFARGLPVGTKLDIAILYDASNRDSEAEADKTMALFNEQLASGSTLIRSVYKRDVKSLGSAAGKKEIFYLTRNITQYFAEVYSFAAAHHIFTMSSDGQCAQAKCCIISAVAGDSVQIYLNQQAMRGIGFDFDAAFKFIAKQL